MNYPKPFEFRHMTNSQEQSVIRNCLLVDDEDMVRQVALRQLKRLDWLADEYGDGLTAVDQFKAEPDKYQLAIVDLNMPKMSGLEVFEVLRSVRPELPVILVSGDTSTAAIENDPKAALLNKPYRRDDLVQVIDSLI